MGHYIIGLDKGPAHQIGYVPMIKVLSTYILMDHLAQAQAQAQPVIHGVHPHMLSHQLHHHVNAKLLEELMADQT